MAAPAPRPLIVRFFRTVNGREPAREWLQGFSIEDKKTIGTDIKTVQWAWPIGMPLVDNLGEGLWEIRTNLGNRIVRVFFHIQDEQVVILHGIIKKTQKTPTQDLKLARQRQSLCVQATQQTNERKSTKTGGKPPHRK